jgi:hypothetical protein
MFKVWLFYKSFLTAEYIVSLNIHLSIYSEVKKYGLNFPELPFSPLIREMSAEAISWLVLQLWAGKSVTLPLSLLLNLSLYTPKFRSYVHFQLYTIFSPFVHFKLTLISCSHFQYCNRTTDRNNHCTLYSIVKIITFVFFIICQHVAQTDLWVQPLASKNDYIQKLYATTVRIFLSSIWLCAMFYVVMRPCYIWG